MEDESEIIMQAGIKIPLLLFYYFLGFIQERMAVKEHQDKDKNIIEQLSNRAYLNLEDLYREIYCNTTYNCHIFYLQSTESFVYKKLTLGCIRKTNAANKRGWGYGKGKENTRS